MKIKKRINETKLEDEEVLSKNFNKDFDEDSEDLFDESLDYNSKNEVNNNNNDDDLFREDLDMGFNDNIGGGFSPMEKHSDLLKSLTDFEPFMKTIVSEWLGMVWSEKDEKYVDDPDVEPTMNIYGARWCINFLRVYTRDNNIITNLDKDTYADIMADVIETVFLNIGCRAEEFNIDNDGDILKVSNQLCHATALILVGTGGTNNYKDLLTKSVSRNENVSYMEQTGNRNTGMPQKKGFFNGISNYFSGK